MTHYNDMISAREAAKIIGCGYQSLLNYARSGKIKSVRNPFNRRILFSLEEVERVAAMMRVS